MMELPLDRREVRIDIRMIELEVVEYRGAGPVVHELRPLVEECRVVFVGFDHEERLSSQACARVEVARYAADEKARLEPRVLENPRRERARGRLAVSARD